MLRRVRLILHIAWLLLFTPSCRDCERGNCSRHP